MSSNDTVRNTIVSADHTNNKEHNTMSSLKTICLVSIAAVFGFAVAYLLIGHSTDTVYAEVAPVDNSAQIAEMQAALVEMQNTLAEIQDCACNATCGTIATVTETLTVEVEVPTFVTVTVPVTTFVPVTTPANSPVATVTVPASEPVTVNTPAPTATPVVESTPVPTTEPTTVPTSTPEPVVESTPEPVQDECPNGRKGNGECKTNNGNGNALENADASDSGNFGGLPAGPTEAEINRNREKCAAGQKKACERLDNWGVGR